MSRTARAAALIVLLAGWFLAQAAPAGAAPVSATVDLLGQSPSVQGHGTWTARLAVNAPDPAHDLVEVLIFGQLITRSDFDAVLEGHLNGYSSFHPTIPLSHLQADPTGGVDVTVPVNAPGTTGGLPSFSIYSGSGVYPVQFVVTGPGGEPLSAPLTTFLVYDDGTGTFPPLSVALVVPYTTHLTATPDGRIVPPSGPEAARLDSLATVLNADSSVPLSLLADPLVLAALQEGAASGSATDRYTLANLAGVPQGGLVEVLPATYSGVDPGDLATARLSSEIAPQLSAGAQELTDVFGAGPPGHDWVQPDNLSPATAAALGDAGFSGMVLPDATVSPLPSPPPTTFASRTELEAGGYHFHLLSADTGIAADFSRAVPPVLAANQLVAELSMIQTETPGVKGRVIVALPPAAWRADPQFVSALISALAGDRLLAPVTVNQALAGAAVARDDPVRTPRPTPAAGPSPLSASAAAILAARREVQSLASMFPSQPQQLSSLPTEVLVAASEVLDSSQRSALLASLSAATARLTRQISLPPATSITLTSTSGHIPITILSASPLRPRVQLVLNSQRLIFEPFHPPNGSCSIPTRSQEICLFILGEHNTTLDVPVQARSSGVFPLAVELSAPGGTRSLGSERDTVRSTAVSGVGVVLIIVAGLSLALWWGRDLRRGRRPPTMIRSPLSDPPGDECHLNGRDEVEPEVVDRTGRL